MKDEPPRVLIGFAEAFAAIEAVWSLQRAGFRVMLLHRAGARAASRSLRDVEHLAIPAPEQDVESAVSALRAHLSTSRPAAFLPLDDAALLMSTLLPWGDTVVVGPGLEAALLALDKAAQVERAREFGLPVPESSVFNTVWGIESIDRPSILKPVDAVRIESNRLLRPSGRVVSSPSELRIAQERMQHGRVILQPLIEGVGEGIFGYCDEDGVHQWSAHQRVRMVNPQGSASSACRSIPPDPSLQPKIAGFLRSLDWRGLFMIELLRDSEGTPWFMELNGRAWGSLALARRRGLEYPAWSTQAALGRPVTPALPAAPAPVRARHLGRELLHLAFVVRGPQSAALKDRWPSRRATVRALLTVKRIDRLYNWNPRQPWVLVADTFHTLRAQLQPRGR